MSKKREVGLAIVVCLVVFAIAVFLGNGFSKNLTGFVVNCGDGTCDYPDETEVSCASDCSCTETDSGLNLTVYGITTGVIATNIPPEFNSRGDWCSQGMVNTSEITEAYCGADNTLKRTTLSCDKEVGSGWICSGGKCVDGTIAPSALSCIIKSPVSNVTKNGTDDLDITFNYTGSPAKYDLVVGSSDPPGRVWDTELCRVDDASLDVSGTKTYNCDWEDMPTRNNSVTVVVKNSNFNAYDDTTFAVCGLGMPVIKVIGDYYKKGIGNGTVLGNGKDGEDFIKITGSFVGSSVVPEGTYSEPSPYKLIFTINSTSDLSFFGLELDIIEAIENSTGAYFVFPDDFSDDVPLGHSFDLYYRDDLSEVCRIKYPNATITKELTDSVLVSFEVDSSFNAENYTAKFSKLNSTGSEIILCNKDANITSSTTNFTCSWTAKPFGSYNGNITVYNDDGDSVLCVDGGAISLSTGLSDCGNGIIDFGEDCDGINLNGKNCSNVGGYTAGTLACLATCSFDKSGCTGASTTPLSSNTCTGNADCDSDENCVNGRCVTKEPSEFPWMWVWIILGIILLVVIVFIIFLVAKSKKAKLERGVMSTNSSMPKQPPRTGPEQMPMQRPMMNQVMPVQDSQQFSQQPGRWQPRQPQPQNSKTDPMMGA